MLPISKQPEPAGLRKYKKDWSQVASYEDFTRFKAEFLKLRKQLLKEQKHVCAYCGQHLLIVENANGVAQMKTEHFSPQNGTAANDLNYQNLLACCLGNQDRPGDTYCDSKKAKTSLSHLQNPSTLSTRDRKILYKVNPKQEEVIVLSENAGKDFELNKDVLNLNHDYLKSRRFQMWKNEVHKKLGEEKTWTVPRVREVRVAYAQTSVIDCEDFAIIDGNLVRGPVSKTCHKEFKDFILWHLDKWLQKAQI